MMDGITSEPQVDANRGSFPSAGWGGDIPRPTKAPFGWMTTDD